MSYFEELIGEPWRFDLLDILRRVEREHPDKPRIGQGASVADDFVVVSQNPYMEFPASNLEGAVKESSGRLRLTARFLGMFGPQGALPLSTTEEAYSWLLERDDAFPRFVDIFQRRFLALFFRAWADARPIAQNDRPDEDRFRAYIGSMIGVGTPAFRGVDSLSDFSKMEFAGLLAPRVKSASRLRSFLSGLFGVRVEIEEFVGAWLPLDPGERSRLGANQSRLGDDCVLGASLFTVGDRFRVRVFARDLPHYEEFLPGAEFARRVADAVFLYVGEEYDWDMELAIPAGKIAPVRLGKGAKLGWTSWMAPNWSKTDETLRRDARFHVADRLAHERKTPVTN
jgi:type VI secretion system protein ImpH